MRIHTVQRYLALALLVALGGCSGSSNSGNSASSTGPSATSSTAQPAPPAPAPPPPVVVDAGTMLTVVLDQTISTKDNSTGDRFAASLAEPVTVAGATAIPAHSRISGTVTESDQAGHIKGGASLAITLDSITVDGTKYSIHTSSYEKLGKGRGKRTAIGGGGGAAAGAIIGALAGGGKGAAIGALAGGGAGTAGAAYTGDRNLTIPAEARIHFKMLKALSISQGQ